MAGVPPELMHNSTPETDWPQWKGIAARSAVCLVAGLFGWWCHDRSHPLSTAAYMVAFLAGGWDLAQEVWHDLRKVRFDTHFLMLLVVPGAVAIGAWGEGALLLFLFSASSAMECFAAERTQREIRSLLNRAPKTARLVTDAGESIVSVDEIAAEMRVRLLPGDMVPVDGVVVLGESSCDESSLTGESIPTAKTVGDELMAGTVNQAGMLEMRVTRPAGESTLQRIILLIQDAQKQKAPVQRFTDKFGSAYTGFVILACLSLFFVSWRFFNASPFMGTLSAPSAFYRAMTLLVVLSPCALVLSVPSAILSTIAAGARRGILFRGGAAVESLATINVVAMDKTGTLTHGKFELVCETALAGALPDCRALALGLARASSHPISLSLAKRLEGEGVQAANLTGFENVPGRGIRGFLAGQEIRLGNREFALEIQADPMALPGARLTETWLSSAQILAFFEFADLIRPESRGLIASLTASGIRPVMLTGDQAKPAARIASEAGIVDFRAGLKPKDKVEAIQRMRAEGGRVAMIGDGVNDAPCLAAADVGVAMGAGGSDAAIEQADVVLMHDRIERFEDALDLSRRARRVIRQNLVLSLGAMAFMGVTALIWSGLKLSAGVAVHEGSTALVVLNSLRLLFPPGNNREDRK